MNATFDQIESVIPLETIIRLLIAVGAGAVIGWERENREKPAGLRTHMMVSLGAAAFMIGALEITATVGDDNPSIRLDPIRALSGIIGGVGFLGAGTIIQSRGSVRGITTAASIWVVAAIGTSCGLGQYRLAIACGVLALIVLWAVGRFEYQVLESKEDSDSAESAGD